MNISNDPTNLLPHGRMRAFEQQYLVRLATVAMMCLALLIIACGVLLIPLHIFLSQRIALQSDQLISLTSIPESADQQDMVMRRNALQRNEAYLATLAHIQRISPALKTALAVSHQNVQVNGVTFTRDTTTQSSYIALSGTADSRDALRTYYLALEAMPGVASADLPVSTYAKESTIPFTITLIEAGADSTRPPQP